MMKPSAIAIVGMAGRFPGARNVRQFWENLRGGVESIRLLSDAELIAAGATEEEIKEADYVKRAAVLDDVDLFDAPFFSMSPNDAAIMDPQHRHFLECAWEALEDAAHAPRSFNGSIGVFAGSGLNSYLIHNLLGNRELVKRAGLFQLKQTGNDKDVLATRTSYQFDLRGPSINVQTACSTSLVAVHLACQSLLNFECDMALAGGVTIEIPHGRGYRYREGEILSRDGRCRSFDALSTGTVFGSGVGVVVLRRLEDAIADSDAIRAVILGSAINNDGARKIGYLAPSVEGQAEVIAEALDYAGVSADDISYIEAHGTGTIVGDPIEVRALTQAFRRSTNRVGFCAIGSLKTNVGHLDAASGVVALIKTVLALQHAQMPASLHFHTPNPHIEFADGPFFVNSMLKDWPSTGAPRRAGVTSLGIGGTNAHVVLEETPARPVSQASKPIHLFPVSGKTESAVEAAAVNMVEYLGEYPEVSLGDAAFTLQVGRQPFAHRRAWVVDEKQNRADKLEAGKPKLIAKGVAPATAPQVVFMFSGQGSQYVNMGREFYEHEVVFREALDICAEQLREPLGVDLRRALYPDEGVTAPAAKALNETWLTQPALFAMEYALARWWMSLGIQPAAMVGHSIGEYVAACLAGVISLEDALQLAAFRGRLMFGLPAGAMLAVSAPVDALHLPDDLSLAAINGRNQCVVSGPVGAIRTLEQDLAMQSVACQRLVASHAFHSAMMDPILIEFEERVRGISLHPPRIPYLSNVSGGWITDGEATDPANWARHLRHTVRFSDCLTELRRRPERVLLEVGPGTALTTLARQEGAEAFHSLPHGREASGGLACGLHTLGELWVRGVKVDWENMRAAGSARRVSLPTYPFEHKIFWIGPDGVEQAASPTRTLPVANDKELKHYRRVWKSASVLPGAAPSNNGWMIFKDASSLGDVLAGQLRAQGQDVFLIEPGSSYKQSDEWSYTVRIGARSDYLSLIADIRKAGAFPGKVVHLGPYSPGDENEPLDDVLDRCFFSPLFLVQALAEEGLSEVDIALVSGGMQQVSTERCSDPARAVLLGPARVIPLELPGNTCRSIDVEFEPGAAAQTAAVIQGEMSSASEAGAVAYRGGVRFVETLQPLSLTGLESERQLVQSGVYLITGGLGGVGLAVAEHLAREFKARLVLVSRTAVPAEAEWEACLSDMCLSGAERKRIRKLIEIRSVAGGLLVAQGDVTNLEQMKKVAALSKEKFGQVDGVFHAAGVLDDGPLMLKTAEAARRVLEAKVRGTLVLEEVFRETKLRCFVLFSSTSSIIPAAGQVDYAAANAFLDAFALSRKGKVTVIDWGAWRDVGMAARTGNSHPLLQERLLNTADEVVYSSRLSAQGEWVLAEHGLKEGEGLKALLPGTAYMEMAAAAFPGGTLAGAIEFQDVSFHTPLWISGEERRDVRTQLSREADGGQRQSSFRFAVFSRGEQWIEHCNGTIATCMPGPVARVDLATIVARCADRTIAFDEQQRTRQERRLQFGPRWHSLRRLHLGTGEGVAEIELNERLAPEVASYRMHPALVDLATGVSLYLVRNYEETEDLFLPIFYRRMRLYRSLPAKFFSHIRKGRQNENGGAVESFDITLIDGQGQVLAEIEGFSMRRIEDVASLLKANPEAQGVSTVGQEQLIEVTDGRGIDPQVGVRDLVRILSVRSPSGLVAVAESLPELRDRKAAPPARAGAVKGQLAGETIEAAIAGWWQEMLGVERVGPDDDFFDLGGHSLVGVRFLAAVRKAYGVDLDLGVLFEARTARGIAEVIAKSKDRKPESGRLA